MESAGNKKKGRVGVVVGLGLIMTLIMSGCLSTAKESEEMGRLEKPDTPLIDTLAPTKTATATFALG